MPADPSAGAGSGLILLAAGASSRFGSPKQLVRFEGESLLRRAARTAIASGCEPVIVVLGANAERLLSECVDLAVTIVVNVDWEEGMSSSIRRGVATLDEFAVADVVLLLVDQPLVTADALRTLVALRREHGALAAAAVYPDGALGPPVVFDRRLFPDLLALRGAHGAKTLLRSLSPDAIARLPLPEAALDIDTVNDYSRLRESNSG